MQGDSKPDNTQTFRRRERRRMIKVKDTLAAAVAHSGDTRAVNAAFLLAGIDYLSYIVGRFCAQGRANIERLGPRVEAAGDHEGQEVTAAIAAALARTERELALLVAASRTDQPVKSRDATPSLVAAARRWTDFHTTELAAQKNPAQQIIERYFPADEYWALTNDITPAVIAREDQLFKRLLAALPPGVEIDQSD